MNQSQQENELDQISIEEVLDNLPCSPLYERSWMHKDQLNYIISSQKLHLIITISFDGCIKVWKKLNQLIDFAFQLNKNSQNITDVELSQSNQSLVIVEQEQRTIKIIDLTKGCIDKIIKLMFYPYACAYIEMQLSSIQLIYVSDANSGDICVIDETKEDKDKVLAIIKIHSVPVRYLKYLSNLEIVISIDVSGRIEIWDPSTHHFPKNNSNINYKVTDLHELYKNKLQCQGLCIGSQHMSLYCNDKKIRIFNILTGKIRLTIDETLDTNLIRQNDQNHPDYHLVHLEQQDYERRLLIEKDIDKQPEQLKQFSMAFDETENILMYCSFVGVKFVNLNDGSLMRLLGKTESSQRFMRLALFQGQAMKNTQTEQQHTSLNRKEIDPTLYVSAHKSNKFYVFSRRMPADILIENKI